MAAALASARCRTKEQKEEDVLEKQGKGKAKLL